jgi:hypothetical protein
MRLAYRCLSHVHAFRYLVERASTGVDMQSLSNVCSIPMLYVEKGIRNTTCPGRRWHDTGRRHTLLV